MYCHECKTELKRIPENRIKDKRLKVYYCDKCKDAFIIERLYTNNSGDLFFRTDYIGNTQGECNGL